MTTPLPSFDQLSDPDLLREVTRLAAREREATARLVASLAVLDRRRLYLAEGYSSMFAYCTEALHLSEGSAYKRITAARAAQRFPVILERLAEGTVSLATVNLLAAHLTVENHGALLEEVRHCSKREVEEVVVRLRPRPDVPPTVRKFSTPTAPPPTAAVACTNEGSATLGDTVPVQPPSSRASTSSPGREAAGSPTLAPSATSDTHSDQARACQITTTTPPQATITPLAPTRYRLTVTLSAETYKKLRQAQDLLRHAIPDGDLSVLVDRALTVLLRDAAKTKLAATDKPRPIPSREAHPGASAGVPSATPKAGSRRIPAAVKREVWQRDGGQCAFISASGHRCRERAWLEFHHVVPYANGGEASVWNLQLRCRRHNAYDAERDFGPRAAMRVRETAPAYRSDRVFAGGGRGPASTVPRASRQAMAGRGTSVGAVASSPRGELAIWADATDERVMLYIRQRASRPPAGRSTDAHHGHRADAFVSCPAAPAD